MRYVQGAILLVFFGAVAIFAFQNSGTIQLKFLNVSIQAPLALEVVGVYLLGMLSGWTVVSFVRHGIRRVSEHRSR